MISEFLSIIDHLLKLTQYRNARLNKRFDDLFEPTFNELLMVHGDYIEMFEKTYSLLPPPVSGSVSKKQLKERDEQMGKAIEYLREKRRAFEPVREKLRALAVATQDMSVGIEERVFLDALLSYFPRAALTEKTTPSDSLTLLMALEYYDNNPQSGPVPVSAFNRFLDPSKYIKEKVAELVEEHRRSWSRVSETFVPLKIASASRK